MSVEKRNNIGQHQTLAFWLTASFCIVSNTAQYRFKGLQYVCINSGDRKSFERLWIHPYNLLRNGLKNEKAMKLV
jgi:hypothetical protein